FGLFTVGGLLSLFWMAGHLDGGFAEYWQVASAGGKTQLWDARFGFAPELEFTFWVALLAVPFQNLTAFGVDQLNAQRMFCCQNASDARKAIIWSSVGQLLTLLMLLVGAGLYVFYHTHPPVGEVAQSLAFNEQGVPANGDLVYPVWIVSELPVGLSGLILAGIFAAAISSLDSILAALSQTTLSLIHNPERADAAVATEESDRRLVRQSRWLVVIWGVVLTGFTMLMYIAQTVLKIPVLPLAFGMTAYTMGPLLGMFFCALAGRGSLRGLIAGSVVSFLLVAFIRLDLWVLLDKAGLDISWLTWLPSYAVADSALGIKATVGYFWAWPVTTLITFLAGWFFAKKEG
ncbi:MAG: sodium:solute symporter family transporter, partial [Verrucomicrobiales bacterium]